MRGEDVAEAGRRAVEAMRAMGVMLERSAAAMAAASVQIAKAGEAIQDLAEATKKVEK